MSVAGHSFTARVAGALPESLRGVPSLGGNDEIGPGGVGPARGHCCQRPC